MDVPARCGRTERRADVIDLWISLANAIITICRLVRRARHTDDHDLLA